MTLEEKVISIIMEQLDVTREECVPEASFIDDLGADSLDLVELIMEMEETFDVQIADNELEKIRTIKDVLDFLKSKGTSGMSSGRRPMPSRRFCLVGRQSDLSQQGEQLKRRVVITGMGAVTPLGNSVAETWEGICRGKSGIGKHHEVRLHGFRNEDRRRAEGFRSASVRE